MQIGPWQLDTVSGGTFRPDGGTMFGIVPKPLWQKHHPADELNRIRAATNCVLARDGTHTVLIDTGYGGKLSDRERELYAAEEGEPLLESLAEVGLSAEDIDTVVLSHLHFDHAGGGTRPGAVGVLVPTFPRARYIVQRAEWEDATTGAPELGRSYPPENFVPLDEAGQVAFVDGDVQILPGLGTLVTGGHTRAHQAVVFGSGRDSAIYLGDLCPTAAHVRSHWCMAYDLYPLDTRRRKPRLLGQAADEGWLVLWDHDPDWAGSRLVRDREREFAVVEAVRRL